MGYSITQEQHETLEKNRRSGRLCAMSTRGGGCYTSATTAHLIRSWTYEIGKGDSRLHTQHFCSSHSKVCNVVGVNFEVISTERLPSKRCPYCGGTETRAISYSDPDFSDDEVSGSPSLVVYLQCDECGERS